jgi:hypothetical protein
MATAGKVVPAPERRFRLAIVSTIIPGEKAPGLDVGVRVAVG